MSTRMSPVTTFMRGGLPPTPLGQEKPVPCMEQVHRTGSWRESGSTGEDVTGSKEQTDKVGRMSSTALKIGNTDREKNLVDSFDEIYGGYSFFGLCVLPCPTFLNHDKRCSYGSYCTCFNQSATGKYWDCRAAGGRNTSADSSVVKKYWFFLYWKLKKQQKKTDMIRYDFKVLRYWYYIDAANACTNIPNAPSARQERRRSRNFFGTLARSPRPPRRPNETTVGP